MTLSTKYKKAAPTIPIILAALVAASGTTPYGWKFSYTILHSPMLNIFLGIIFASTATFANAALGAYSLLDALQKWRHETFFKVIILLGVSFAAAIPLGFICFVGYQGILPVAVNIFISIIVVIINTGVGFTAINNLLMKIISYFNQRNQDRQRNYHEGSEKTSRIVGFLLGLAVTLTFYLAGTDGLSLLLANTSLNKNLIRIISYSCAFIIWIPAAALFSNSSQEAGGIIYKYVSEFHKLKEIHLKNIVIIIIAVLSGAAYTQMTVEFFNINKNIPMIFKSDIVIFFSHHVLTVISYLVSIAVNEIALTNALKKVEFFHSSTS